MLRSCDVCGIDYQAKLPSSKYCSGACRTKAYTARKSGSVMELKSEPSVSSHPGELADAVRCALDSAGRTETWQGRSALAIATRLDSETTDSGSSLAALHKQLDAVMGKALDGAQCADDPLDELQARRDRKRDAG